MDEDCHDALAAHEIWYTGCYAETTAETGDMQFLHSTTPPLIADRGREMKRPAGDSQSLYSADGWREEGKEDPSSAEDALLAESLNPLNGAANMNSPEMDRLTTEPEVVGTMTSHPEMDRTMTSHTEVVGSMTPHPEASGSEKTCDVEALGQFGAPLRFLPDRPFRLQRRRRKLSRSAEASLPIKREALDGGGLMHLSNLLIVLEQLEQVLRLNKSLERRCDFLRVTRSLVKYHNSALRSETRLPPTPRHLAPRYVKRSASTCLQSISFDVGDPAFHSSFGGDTIPRRSLLGETGNGVSGYGAVTGTGVDHEAVDGGAKAAGEKVTPVACERKKSKKLQAKWEQVKKVFSGKTELAPRKTEEDVARDAGKFKNRKSKRFSTIVALSDVAVESLRSASTQGREDPCQEHGPSSPSSVKSEPTGTESIGTENMGTEVNGTETMGTDAMETDAVVTEAIGTEAMGTESMGIEAMGIEAIEADVRLAWIDDGLNGQGQRRQKLRHSCSVDSSADASIQNPRRLDEELGMEKMDDGRTNEDKMFVYPDGSGTRPKAEKAGSGSEALETSSTGGIVRSKSFKVPGSAGDSPSAGVHLEVAASKSVPSSPIAASGHALEGQDEQVGLSHGVEPGRRARAAWGKVKDIIHTRRESFKLKAHRQSEGRSKSDGHLKSDGQQQDEGRQKVQGHQMDREQPRSNPSDRGEENPEEQELCDASNGPSTSVVTSSLTAQSRQDTLKEKRIRHPSSSPSRSIGFLTKRREKSSSPASRTDARIQRQMTETPRSSRLETSPQDDDRVTKDPDETSTLRRTNARKKSKREFKTIGRAKSVDASVVKFTEDFINKMEEWEEKQKNAAANGGTSSRASRRSHVSESNSTDASMQSAGLGAPPEKVEQLSESFIRTVESWERVRGGRAKSREGRSGVRGKGDVDGARSSSRERSKSAQRMEKELTKIEKKEQKLESELQKLTEMKQRLEESARGDRGQEKVKSTDKASVADGVKNAEKAKGTEKVKEARKAENMEKIKDTGGVKGAEKDKITEKFEGAEKVKDVEKEKLTCVQKAKDTETAKGLIKVNYAENGKVGEGKDTESVNDSGRVSDKETASEEEKVKFAEGLKDVAKVVDSTPVKELDKVEDEETVNVDDKNREKSTDDTRSEQVAESKESSCNGNRPEMNSEPEADGTRLPNAVLAEESVYGLEDTEIKGQEIGSFVNCEAKGVELEAGTIEGECLRLEEAGQMGSVAVIQRLKEEIASKDERMASLDRAMDRLREQVEELQQQKEQRSTTAPAVIVGSTEVKSTPASLTQPLRSKKDGNDTSIITGRDTSQSISHSTIGTHENDKTPSIDSTIDHITRSNINTKTTANIDFDTDATIISTMGDITDSRTITEATCTVKDNGTTERPILTSTNLTETIIIDSTRISSNARIGVETPLSRNSSAQSKPSESQPTQSHPIDQSLLPSSLTGHSVAPKGRERRRSAEDDWSLRRCPSAFRPIFRSVRTHRREPQPPRINQEASYTASQTVRRFRPIVVGSNEGLNDQIPSVSQNAHLLFNRSPVGTPQKASCIINSILEASSRASVQPQRDLEVQRQIMTFTPPTIIALHQIGELCPRVFPNGKHVPDVKNTSETSFQPDWASSAPKYRTLPHCHTSKTDRPQLLSLEKASSTSDGHSLKKQSPFRNTPSPIVLRSLKTAAELMADSERRRIRLRHSSERLGHRSRTTSDDEASHQSEMRTSKSTGWPTQKQEQIPVQTHHQRLVRNVRSQPPVEDCTSSPLPPVSSHVISQNPLGMDSKKSSTSSFEFGRVPTRTFALCSIPPMKKIVPSLGNGSDEKVRVGSANSAAPITQSRGKSSVSNHKTTAFCVTATNTDRATKSLKGSNPGQEVPVGIGDEKVDASGSLRISDAQPPPSRGHSGVDKTMERKTSESGGQTSTSKTKPKFLDGGWLIRSKKFFKSSK